MFILIHVHWTLIYLIWTFKIFILVFIISILDHFGPCTFATILVLSILFFFRIWFPPPVLFSFWIYTPPPFSPQIRTSPPFFFFAFYWFDLFPIHFVISFPNLGFPLIQCVDVVLSWFTKLSIDINMFINSHLYIHEIEIFIDIKN